MKLDSTTPLLAGGAMPVLGLGTWQLGDKTADVVRVALEIGYRMIDTSGDYGTQPGVGEGLRSSGLTRDEVFLVTKVEEHDDSFEATWNNLAEMGVEYADLVLIHRPPPEDTGAELWRGLQKAREEGLVRRLGVSNYGKDLLDRLVEETGEVPVVNQIEWSPFGWSADILDSCRQRGIVLQAYSPLARAQRLDDPTLAQIADAQGRTRSQVVLRWHLQHGVVPLPKASSVDHLRENADVFDFELDDFQMAALDSLNEHWSSLSDEPLHC